MASDERGSEGKGTAKIIAIGFGVMLIMATLTSAYSVWQAASYSASSTTDLGIANGLRTESSKYLTFGLQEEQVDVGTWLSWASAVSVNNTSLADFIEERFREEFKPAFYAWLNSTNSSGGVPEGTPFSLPTYRNANIEKSESIDEQIEETMKRSDQKGDYASRLTLMTVLMASIIVICGFESRMRREMFKLPILITVIAIYIFTLWAIAQVPPNWAF